jgi:YfiH family protein
VRDAAFYPFALEFEGGAARFPFLFDGKPVTRIAADGTAAPSCLVSSRGAGDMRFDPSGAVPHGLARASFFRAHTIPPGRVYSLVQVHSRDVFVVRDDTETPAAFARAGDGMVSFSRSAFLAVTTADCLPVFLLDTVRGCFAALHSGWKGTGIVLNALSIMREAGTAPEHVAAVFGPCIQRCCYRVDQARADAFDAEFGGVCALGPAVERRTDGAYIGLQAANALLLTGAGVRHIAYCTDCTFTSGRLGSYRREGAQSYTRMIALAGAQFA